MPCPSDQNPLFIVSADPESPGTTIQHCVQSSVEVAVPGSKLTVVMPKASKIDCVIIPPETEFATLLPMFRPMVPVFVPPHPSAMKSNILKLLPPLIGTPDI